MPGYCHNMIMLKSALIVLLSAAPSSAGWTADPVLNRLRAADIAAERSISPDPVPGPAMTVLIPGAAALSSKSGYIQILSATKLKMDKEKGVLTITFPKVEFGDGLPDDRADLYVKLFGSDMAPVISWATVICGGPNFIGYKGSTVDFPRESGNLSITETLALGSPKLLIARTHPWLAGDLASMEELCSDGFRERMRDARAQTLPSSIGRYSLEFNARKNTLRVKW